MVDATDTPAVPPVPPAAEVPAYVVPELPNQDLHDEIAEKRELLLQVRQGHTDTAAEQAADYERRQLEAESAKLDAEIAAAEAAAEHQANAPMPGEANTEESSLTARRNSRRAKRAGA